MTGVQTCALPICATDKGNHLAALKMVEMQGGVFGAVASSAAVIEAIS